MIRPAGSSLLPRPALRPFPALGPALPAPRPSPSRAAPSSPSRSPSSRAVPAPSPRQPFPRDTSPPPAAVPPPRLPSPRPKLTVSKMAAVSVWGISAVRPGAPLTRRSSPPVSSRGAAPGRPRPSSPRLSRSGTRLAASRGRWPLQAPPRPAPPPAVLRQASGWGAAAAPSRPAGARLPAPPPRGPRAAAGGPGRARPGSGQPGGGGGGGPGREAAGGPCRRPALPRGAPTGVAPAPAARPARPLRPRSRRSRSAPAAARRGVTGGRVVVRRAHVRRRVRRAVSPGAGGGGRLSARSRQARPPPAARDRPPGGRGFGEAGSADVRLSTLSRDFIVNFVFGFRSRPVGAADSPSASRGLVPLQVSEVSLPLKIEREEAFAGRWGGWRSGKDCRRRAALSLRPPGYFPGVKAQVCRRFAC